ncbi:MAG TPA: hypothetical protein VF841_14640, partial [Anaeromyxobacter sp.]
MAEDLLQLLDRPARDHPLARERVARRLVPAEAGAREAELSKRGAQVRAGCVLVDLLAVAAHGRNQQTFAARLLAPGGEDGEERVEDRDHPAVLVLERPLDRLADVDPPRREVDVRPLQREDLASAELGERADGVGDVERAWQGEVDAADVLEPLDERRRSRVVRRPHEAHDRARQVARRVPLRDAALGEIGEERRQDGDEDADRRRVHALGELRLDERANSTGVHLGRTEVGEVGREVVLPARAVLGAGAVGELATREEVRRDLAQPREAARVGEEAGPALGEVGEDLRQDALRIVAGRATAARAAPSALAPPDLPGSVPGLIDGASPPLPPLPTPDHRSLPRCPLPLPARGGPFAPGPRP